MNRTLLICSLALVVVSTTVAQAGWHHRHHHATVYQAAPAYYAPMYAPSYAPGPGVMQSAPSSQSALGEIIIAKLVGKLLDGMDKGELLPGFRREDSGNNNGGGSGGGSVSDSSIKQDLSDIKAALKDLDARVENANSALQRQGTEILSLRQAVEGLNASVDESSDIGKAAKKTLLNSKSLNEIEAALNDPKFKTAADAYKAAAAPAADMLDKPIQDLREAVKGLLKP